MSALRLRPLMTYAYPHWAIQLRIALIRVHLALADVAGARTLMREVDEVLKRRPDLGTLVVEAAALRGPAGEGAPPGRPRSIRPDRRCCRCCPRTCRSRRSPPS